MTAPLVSVVTPFHNTAAYLADCIESVLAQSYREIEYILVDNCSTDGSLEIAQRYAARDSRIKIIRRSSLLTQVANYNAALAEISAESKYCKLVQADDYIFPECLRLMVDVFEQSDSVGLVSAYDLKGDKVRGSGIPIGDTISSGTAVARLILRRDIFVFGSPTTVMYRSSVVRASNHFYEESLLHEDTEKCMQILKDWDFGFVHQVLSFLREDPRSVTGSVRRFQPNSLDRYIIVQRYAAVFLSSEEAARLLKDSRRFYYRDLAEEAVRFPGSAFWKYHQKGLNTLGQKIDSPYLALQICREIFTMLVNPGSTIALAFRRLTRRQPRK